LTFPLPACNASIVLFCLPSFPCSINRPVPSHVIWDKNRITWFRFCQAKSGGPANIFELRSFGHPMRRIFENPLLTRTLDGPILLRGHAEKNEKILIVPISNNILPEYPRQRVPRSQTSDIPDILCDNPVSSQPIDLPQQRQNRQVRQPFGWSHAECTLHPIERRGREFLTRQKSFLDCPGNQRSVEPKEGTAPQW
jgi:hypothetical protein